MHKIKILITFNSKKEVQEKLHYTKKKLDCQDYKLIQD